jgi:hypothetical protein
MPANGSLAGGGDGDGDGDGDGVSPAGAVAAATGGSAHEAPAAINSRQPQAACSRE